jgi:hypothetical protein
MSLPEKSINLIFNLNLVICQWHKCFHILYVVFLNHACVHNVGTMYMYIVSVNKLLLCCAWSGLTKVIKREKVHPVLDSNTSMALYWMWLSLQEGMVNPPPHTFKRGQTTTATIKVI